ncbi:MAG: hypothetical protein AB9888_00210 [Bacteroidales bacterium]
MGGSGTGGGAIRLLISDQLIVNGMITASPVTGYYTCSAGGSIFISSQKLSGTGEIRTHGDYVLDGAEIIEVVGGDGGYISVYYGEGDLFKFSDVTPTKSCILLLITAGKPLNRVLYSSRICPIRQKN